MKTIKLRIFLLTFMKAKWLVVLGIFWLPTLGFSSLVINPVLLEFSPKNLVQEIVMDNQSSEAKTFQASIKQWQQVDGKDVYKETDDIVLFPLMAKLPPKSKQKFRLILKNVPKVSHQISYRLFFEENKSRISKQEESAITFLLNMTVPVLAIGPEYKSLEKVDWSADYNKKENTVTISVSNQSNNFIKIRNITAKEMPNFMSNDWQYVLPKTTITWTTPQNKKTIPNKLTLTYVSAELSQEIAKLATVTVKNSVTNPQKIAAKK